jgi:hypothetical protein
MYRRRREESQKGMPSLLSLTAYLAVPFVAHVLGVCLPVLMALTHPTLHHGTTPWHISPPLQDPKLVLGSLTYWDVDTIRRTCPNPSCQAFGVPAVTQHKTPYQIKNLGLGEPGISRPISVEEALKNNDDYGTFEYESECDFCGHRCPGTTRSSSLERDSMPEYLLLDVKRYQVWHPVGLGMGGFEALSGALKHQTSSRPPYLQPFRRQLGAQQPATNGLFCCPPPLTYLS